MCKYCAKTSKINFNESRFEMMNCKYWAQDCLNVNTVLSIQDVFNGIWYLVILLVWHFMMLSLCEAALFKDQMPECLEFMKLPVLP